QQYRNREEKIYDAFNSAILPIEQLRFFVASGSSTVIPPAAVCFGVVTDMVRASKDLSAQHDRIMELLPTPKVS
ncbi:hypothetical protein P154DRAFT_381262, partial [Amniculicola lignicola CBS 123094]